MTVEEYLRQVTTAKMELEVSNEVKEELIDAATRVKGINYSREKLQGGKAQDLGDKIAKVLEETDKIDKKVERLAELIVEARELIESLSNGMERTILHRKYFLGQTNEQIAEKIGKSKKTVKRHHDRALERIKCKLERLNKI